MPYLKASNSKLCLVLGMSMVSSSALASPQAFMSSRSFAMGGTGVAIAHPSAASANPAMMAADQHDWADDFGFTLPSINARVADEEEVVDQIDDIQDSIDGFDRLVSDIKNTPTQGNVGELGQSAGDIRDRLIDFNKDTIRANIGLGLSFAVPSKTLSVGVFTNANLTATVRGELSNNDRNFLNTLVDAANTQTPDAVKSLVENAATDQDGNISFDSRGRVLASAVGEFGVSFARQLELSNGQPLQLGLTPKYVELRTFQYTESVSGFEDDEFDGDQYQTEKSGFNVDLGAAYAFGDEQQWNAGIAIKNLIPMELKSAASRPDLNEEIRTLELNPMATIGIAHRSDFHVVTAEVDLTKKEAFGFEDDTQWLALGAEFDVFRFAQLRGGVRYNLASNDDNQGISEEAQLTAGIGLNLFGARLDLGALFSDADTGAALEFGAAF
ncbi:conjugal transfer protein TraF [Marinobacter sp. S6332]|uniref:conjugal transfer protein TraF n=1 Tax=Marinobacter sp. S6332 TaxID=2926403 RepID=UPI001FF3B72B|nr:conjugal transfer protein TraF [Marinobacter sp. S6332]MCK0163148.1 conjugal transfer protein TraF [Marinobacter sp. S6332]